MIQEKNH